VIRLYKEGDDIPTPLQIGDIIEVQSGVFVKIKEILTENEEDLAGIKKINIRLKGEVVANESNRQKPGKRGRIAR
jgi:hypothetical protein